MVLLSTTFSACLLVLFLSSPASARTDLSGCTTTDVSSPAGASVAWYVPGTGERCDFLDCGGGAGAPLYDVPGCPMYTGMATYSPSYLPGFQAAVTTTSSLSTGTSVSATTTSASVPSEPQQSSLAVESSSSSEIAYTSTAGLVTGSGTSSSLLASVVGLQPSSSSSLSVMSTTEVLVASPYTTSMCGCTGSVASSNGSISSNMTSSIPTTTGTTNSTTGRANATASYVYTAIGAAAENTGSPLGVGLILAALGAALSL